MVFSQWNKASKISLFKKKKKKKKKGPIITGMILKKIKEA